MHRARLRARAPGARRRICRGDAARGGEALSDLAANRDYSSIVSDRHYARLAALIEDARASGARIIEINPAGEKLDPATRKIAPTLVLDAGEGAAIAREEIFGPLFPVIGYEGVEEAIRYVNERPRPLALYWFGENPENRDRVLHGTLAGGVTVNGCLTHFAQESQPFGGVGESGYGTYHGEHGFRCVRQGEARLLPEPSWDCCPCCCRPTAGA